MQLNSLTPGIIKSYDQATRLCRVEIPGLTDGAEIFPEAEFCYGVGDKSEHTEVNIIVGDRVWLSFVNGDARYPIIMGYRPKNKGNAPDYRRWHHKNMELYAFDGEFFAHATKDVTVSAGAEMYLNSGKTIHVTGTDKVIVTAPNIELRGNVQVIGASLTHNGTNVGQTHVHGGVEPGGGTTSGPG